MKPLYGFLLLFLLAAAVGFGVFEGIAVRRTDSAVADLRSEHDRLVAALRARNEQNARTARSNADRRQAAATGAGMTRHGEGNVEAETGAAEQLAAQRADVRKRYLAAYRDSLDFKFGLLFRKLNLSPLQQESLKDLLTQREDNNLSVEAAAREKGVPTSDPEIEAMDDALTAANKAAMVDLLGHQGEREVHAFMQDEAVLPLVNLFTSSAASAGAAITADQASDLLGELAAASEKRPSGRVIKDTIDWDVLAAKTTTTLSPAQLTILNLIQTQVQSRQQIAAIVTKLNTASASDKP